MDLRVVLIVNVTAPLAKGNGGCCSLHGRKFHKVFVSACFLPKEVGGCSVGFMTIDGGVPFSANLPCSARPSKSRDLD